MPYPSTITTLTNPTATQKLNSPSHSTIETNQNTEVVAIETFIGTLSSTVGTIMYDVRAAASSGGGHVQAANVGGTGQTSYNKGDILAASSSSVLTKLAVGTDNYALVADSTQTSGLNYAVVTTTANIQNQAAQYAVASVLSASVYGITFATAVTGSVAGQAFVVKFPTSNASSVIALSVSSLTAKLIKMPDLTNPAVGAIQASMIGIIENDGTNWQLHANTDTTLSVTDITANNITVNAHGFAPKGTNVDNNYLNAKGAYTSVLTATATVGGLVPTPPNNTTTFFRGDATFVTPPTATATATGYVPTPPNNTSTFLRGDASFASVLAVTAVTGTAPIVSSGGTTPAISVNNATATAAGAVPTPPNNTTTFFRGDATFNTPPSATATVAGYVPTPPNNTTTFLRGDATFAALTNVTVYKDGVATYDTTLASGTQNIAHGLGVAPKYIRLTGYLPFGASSLTSISIGSYNGTTNSVVWNNLSGTGGNVSGNTTNAIYLEYTGNFRQTGIVTVDATNIIITWTKAGTPTGTAQILWEAEA